MSGQETWTKKPDKTDIARWIIQTGGATGIGTYAPNHAKAAGAEAGKRVFEGVIKGQMKVTFGA